MIFHFLFFFTLISASIHNQNQHIKYDQIYYYQEGLYSDQTANSYIQINLTSNNDFDTSVEIVISDYSARHNLGYNDPSTHVTHYCCSQNYFDSGVCKTVDSLIIDEENANVKRFNVDLFKKEKTSQFVQINVSDFYYLYFVNCDNETNETDFSTMVTYHSEYGYLSGELHGRIWFSTVIIVIYCFLIVIWLLMCCIYCSQVMAIHMLILLITILCCCENLVCLLSLNEHNASGAILDSFQYIYLFFNASKRLTCRILLVMACLGYGVTKTSLQGHYLKLSGISVAYFVLAMIEGILHNTNSGDAIQYIIQFPIILMDIYIYFWFYTSLVETVDSLKEQNQPLKLKLFQKLKCVVLTTAVIALCYLCLYMLYVIGDYLYVYWSSIWFADSGFWDLVYLFALLCIMVLWRPKRNSRAYSHHVQLASGDKQDDEDYGADSVSDTTSLVRKV